MTTSHAARPTTPPAVVRLLGPLALLPSATTELFVLIRGDRAGAARRAGRAGGHEVRSTVVLAHALLAVVFGAVIWFLTGLALLGAVRGPFYGLVDPGPYDHSWGGPSLAGAWAVHAAVWLAVLPVWVLSVHLLAGLRRALTRRLLDGDGPRWVVLVTLLVGLGAGLFVRAWVHQL